jgi:hypothetical protein
MANGLIRHRFGVGMTGLQTSGPVYWAKAVAQAVLRRGQWLAVRRAAKRPVEFKLDGVRPGAVADIAA